MTKKDLKDKYAERAKIFQQAMESCKSSNPIDCIEWFADKIIELEKGCNETQELLDKQIEATYKVVEELNKAKDHIRTLISCLIDWVQEGDKDYCHIAEAEKFLEEVRK